MALTQADLAQVLTTDANSLLASGSEEAVVRQWCTGVTTLTSGTMCLSYFTARRSEPITKVLTNSQDVAAATITLSRVGVYAVADSGNLTLVAATANTTSLWSAAYTVYNPALTATWQKNAGQRYASAILSVGTTMPSLLMSSVDWYCSGLPPRLQGQVTGLTDLPGAVPASSIATGNRLFQMIFQT